MNNDEKPRRKCQTQLGKRMRQLLRIREQRQKYTLKRDQDNQESNIS